MPENKKNPNKPYFFPGVFLATALFFGQCKPPTPPVDTRSLLEQQILRETSKNQTVMFGEVHSKSGTENPYFGIVIPLLPKLKEQGFTYFAVEVPREHQDLVDRVASNRLSKGEYIHEICRRESVSWNVEIKESDILSDFFYDVIKAAGQNGLKVVAYDSWKEDAFARDEKEFLNLKEIIFLQNPTAKVVVYCGALHVEEKSYSAYVITNKIEKDKIIIDFSLKELFSLGKLLSEYTKDKNFSIDMYGKSTESPDARIINGKLKH